MSFMVVAVVVMLLLPVCVMPVSIPAILTSPIVPSVSPALVVVIRLAIVIDIVALRVTVLVGGLISLLDDFQEGDRRTKEKKNIFGVTIEGEELMLTRWYSKLYCSMLF